jgi:hypothetical protein
MSQRTIAYPASERSKNSLEILEELHRSSNWHVVEQDGWHLPATKEKRDDCGKWQTKGCLNVSAHVGSAWEGKVFVKSYQKSCYRADCEICYKKWMGRESNKATRRIEKYQELSEKQAKHVVISVPNWLQYVPASNLRKKAYSILKEVGCIGGTLIFHPFRFDKDANRWYYSPHFHVVGFGWISNVEEVYNKNGWIVKNKGFRNSVFATFYYQLSHAGIKKGYHTLTWFGDLSYSKLKIEKEPNPDTCPLCNAKLRPVFHYGLFGSVPPPETCIEMFVDPEGWHIVESKTKSEQNHRVCNCSACCGGKKKCLN